jgi:hypothetical protein
MLRIGCLSQAASSKGNLHVDYFVTLIRQVYLYELAPEGTDDLIALDRAMSCLTRSLAHGDIYGPDGLVLPDVPLIAPKRRPTRDGMGRRDFEEFQNLIATLRSKHEQRESKKAFQEFHRALANCSPPGAPLTRLEQRFASAMAEHTEAEDSPPTLRLHPVPEEVTL